MKLSGYYTKANVALAMVVVSVVSYSWGVIASGLLVYGVFDEVPPQEVVIVPQNEEPSNDAMYPFTQEEGFIFTSATESAVSTNVCTEEFMESFDNFPTTGNEMFTLFNQGAGFASVIEGEDGDSASLNLLSTRKTTDEPSVLRYKYSNQVENDFVSEITLSNDPIISEEEGSSIAALEVHNGTSWYTVGREITENGSRLVIRETNLDTNEVIGEEILDELDLDNMSYEFKLKVVKSGETIEASIMLSDGTQVGDFYTSDVSGESSDIYFGVSSWDENQKVSGQFDNFKISCN